MNISNNSFPYFNNGRIVLSEFFSMPSTSILESCVVKVNKFFAYGFFKLKIFINLWKQFRKCFTRKSPTKLILSRFFNKVYRSSESLHNPFEDWILGVVESKFYLINKVRSVFRLIFAYSKTTFSINESSKVCNIFLRVLYSVFNRFEYLLMFFRNKIINIFLDSHQAYEPTSFFEGFRFYKSFSDFSLFFSFCKIFKNVIDGVERSLFFKNVLVYLFMTGNYFITRLNTSSIKMFKFVKNVYINRGYYNRRWKLIEMSAFRAYFSNIKTSISVNISGKVGKICLFIFVIHVASISATSLKSIKVTVLDVPTEIQLGDVQVALQALKDADAIELMNREDASTNIGTASVGASYVALGHTSLMPTLKAITNFVETKDYSRTGSVKASEFGAVYYTRFFLSTLGSINASASGLGADVYDIFVKGAESDISVKMMGKEKFIYHDARFDGPLELTTTGGWKENFGHGIQKQKWIVRLRSTLKV